LIPRCTYRIQLSEKFTLGDLEELIDYLDSLGVSTIYASPITAAVPGSTHGYDVIDPGILNPELGTLDDLQRISQKLKDKRMTWLQDIVPNHMAFNGRNHRLMDVLERGPKSPWAGYFDINFSHRGFAGKLMVPFLGDDPDVAIRKNEIQLVLTDGGIIVQCPGDSYPLSLSACAVLEEIAAQLDMPLPEQLLEWINAGNTDTTYEQWIKRKEQIFGSLNSTISERAEINKLLVLVNESPRWITLILDNQFYHLRNWREASSSINFRRFFTISSLIGVRMEEESVFEDYHGFIKNLYENGLIQGVRVDHVDGLFDPSTYLFRLRRLMGKDCYIIVEKILADRETLPQEWPIQGTSGYDFLSIVNRLFLRADGKEKMEALYQRLLPEEPAYSEQVLRSKQAILKEYMAGELDNLSHLLLTLDAGLGSDPEAIKEVLAAWIVHLNVYRIYPDTLPLREREREILIESFRNAVLHTPELSEALNTLLHFFTVSDSSAEKNETKVSFMRKLMQLSSALTAKGVEDTSFYTFSVLISQNEVGNQPSLPGLSVDEFHNRMQDWSIRCSASLNATATHDTKRGEDARMRLNILPSRAEEWGEAVRRWVAMNEKVRDKIGERLIPSRKEEYFIYQSMVAGWPQDLSCPDSYIERLQAAMRKSLREARENSSWDYPDTGYEEACMDFIRKVLSPEHEFIEDFRSFVAGVIEAAVPLSLAQTLIKLTTPGIPDIYQGCEVWDLSYVDPDNRRPVDYDRLKYALKRLDEIESSSDSALCDFFKREANRGVEKLYLIRQVLSFRKRNAALFEKGVYLPLNTSAARDQVICYARHWEGHYVIVVVPLTPYFPLTGLKVHLSKEFPTEWTELFTNQRVGTDDKDDFRLSIPSGFPVACFVSNNTINS